MNKLIDNPGLNALTVVEERIELVQVVAKHSGEALVKAAELRGRKIIFAHMQSDFKGGFIPYWHVTDPTSCSYRSTLSMEGLKEWRVNMRAGLRKCA